MKGNIFETPSCFCVSKMLVQLQHNSAFHEIKDFTVTQRMEINQ